MSQTDQGTPIVDRLKSAREQAGLSQGQVAKLLDMHRPTVSEIEAGRRRVTADELVRFSDIYGVSLDWLTGKVDESADMTDAQVSIVARDLSRLAKEDRDRVLSFIAAVRDSRG